MHIQIVPDSEGLFDHAAVLRTATMLASDGTTIVVDASRPSTPRTLAVSVALEPCGIVVRIPHLPPLCAAPSQATPTLASVVAGLLGYRPVRLTHIAVRDAAGKKSRPEPTLYVKATPALAVPASLVLRRDLVSPHTALLPDTAFPCYAECTVLPSLLAQNDLVFVDVDTEAFYRVLLRNARILIFRECPSPLSFPVENALLLTPLRAATSCLTPPLRTAFHAPFDEDADVAFYEELSKVALADDVHAIAHLADFVSACPPLLDHRARYVKCIADALRSHSFCTEGRGVSACTEYLKIRCVLRIDRVPLGSLTELCNTPVHDSMLPDK